MRTILWGAITANGAYMHGDEGYDCPKEVFDDFYASIAEAGNCIIGRKTFEEMAMAGWGLGHGDVVVVSRAGGEYKEAVSATSPFQALQVLEAKGHAVAFVGGGDSLLNAFLAEGLADELVLVVTPDLTEGQNHIVGTALMTLLEISTLTGGVARLHYSLRR